MLSITKIFTFEAGHALSGYDGACRNIHGHSYKLHISITGDHLHQGILFDFKALKSIVEQSVLNDLDHALLLKRNHVNLSATKNLVTNIHWMDEEPTAESLVTYIGDKVKSALPTGIRLLRVKLYETETGYVEMEYAG